VQAFIWSLSEGFIHIGDFPGGLNPFSQANDVNNLGHVVGVGSKAKNKEAYLWTPQRGLSGLGDLPGGEVYSWALGVNDMDQVVGMSSTGWQHLEVYYGATWTEAFLWDPIEGMKGLGDLPGANTSSSARDVSNSGWVCGDSVSSKGLEAFIWDETNGIRSMGDLPGGGFMFESRRINNLNQVCGHCTDPNSPYSKACVWDPERGLFSLPAPFGVYGSDANDINDAGQVVGYVKDYGPGGKSYSCMWDPDEGIIFVNEVIDASSQVHLPFSSPKGINNKSQMVAVSLTTNLGCLLTPFILGDGNCDGVVNGADLAALLKYLANQGGPVTDPPPICDWWTCDMNQDAQLTVADLELFLGALAYDPAVP
jgi:probable HAF family extracellular repeat protein